MPPTPPDPKIVQAAKKRLAGHKLGVGDPRDIQDRRPHRGMDNPGKYARYRDDIWLGMGPRGPVRRGK